MPIGALTIGALITGAASAASKMGGNIAAANKLKRAQSPESIYAQRYNQSFQNALNADLQQKIATSSIGNTTVGHIAGLRSALTNLNMPGASLAATGDAKNYTQMALQGQQQDADSARQIGDAVGTGLGLTSSALGAIQQGQDRAKNLDLQQERYNQYRQDNIDARNQAAQLWQQQLASQQNARTAAFEADNSRSIRDMAIAGRNANRAAAAQPQFPAAMNSPADFLDDPAIQADIGAFAGPTGPYKGFEPPKQLGVTNLLQGSNQTPTQYPTVGTPNITALDTAAGTRLSRR